MTPEKLAWGLRKTAPQLEAPAFWGARCILEEWRDSKGRVRTQVDVLWDRQDLQGEDEPRAALKAALNGSTHLDDGALSAWRKHAAKCGLLQTEQVHEFRSRGVRFLFSTLASHGYIYVTAHLEAS